jgi:hypothetical protein
MLQDFLQHLITKVLSMTTDKAKVKIKNLGLCHFQLVPYHTYPLTCRIFIMLAFQERKQGKNIILNE